ncbi:hypothetical protein [Microbacterium sp. NIBRBAC000506063]|uniref:hypothetical protein n=1 Tax=Microbacterium sp. NIBRBAC000506063 TaxID=2734618 RepID=UPI001CB6D604|nr:hypothetical protein [Microbacterium sp. NIBRBAC000506063]
MSEEVAQEQRDDVAIPSPPVSAADRLMRRLLRVEHVDTSVKTQREAHRGFRIALVVTGIRCLISYLVIPIGVPILGLSGIVAAPIGLALCVVAVINGVYSLRRFWKADHRSKWVYTWFIAIVFLVLAVAMVSDIARIVSAL